MSGDPKLTIAGNNDLSSEMARHAISSGLADPVYLWRDIRDPLVARTPVLVIADVAERAGFVQAALEAGLRVVSLPIAGPIDADTAVDGGNLRWISLSHGVSTLRRIHSERRSGRVGRQYGVFAAHRLPRNFADDVDEVTSDLIVYATSLVDSPVRDVSVTHSSVSENGFEGRFVLARFADATIVTLEISAVLPESDDSTGERVVEVTGSDAVLRGEPERQSVVVQGSAGFARQPWYEELHGLLLQHALEVFHEERVDQHRSALRLMQGVRTAAASEKQVNLE